MTSVMTNVNLSPCQDPRHDVCIDRVSSLLTYSSDSSPLPSNQNDFQISNMDKKRGFCQYATTPRKISNDTEENENDEILESLATFTTLSSLYLRRHNSLETSTTTPTNSTIQNLPSSTLTTVDESIFHSAKKKDFGFKRLRLSPMNVSQMKMEEHHDHVPSAIAVTPDTILHRSKFHENFDGKTLQPQHSNAVIFPGSHRLSRDAILDIMEEEEEDDDHSRLSVEGRSSSSSSSSSSSLCTNNREEDESINVQGKSTVRSCHGKSSFHPDTNLGDWSRDIEYLIHQLNFSPISPLDSIHRNSDGCVAQQSSSHFYTPIESLEGTDCGWADSNGWCLMNLKSIRDSVHGKDRRTLSLIKRKEAIRRSCSATTSTSSAFHLSEWNDS